MKKKATQVIKTELFTKFLKELPSEFANKINMYMQYPISTLLANLSAKELLNLNVYIEEKSKTTFRLIFDLNDNCRPVYVTNKGVVGLVNGSSILSKIKSWPEKRDTHNDDFLINYLFPS